MKQIMGLCLAVLLGISSGVFAFELDVITGLTGTSLSSDGKSHTGAAATFYRPITDDYTLVFGFSSILPASKDRQMDADVILGVAHPMPLVGDVDMYFTFNDQGGTDRVVKADSKTSDFMTRSFSVRKNWMYALNENINLGVSLILAEVMLEGSKQVNVLSEFKPVLGTTIKF